MKGPWGFFFRRRRVEQDMEAELRSHVRLRAAALDAEGLTPTEAELRARIEFGAGERWREECREALGVRWISELRADLRQGLRQLRRHPGFTLIAVLTLALGIGANTAIFSMLDGMLLHALPYPQPQQLYEIGEVVPQYSALGSFEGVNAANFTRWQARCPAFTGMAEMAPDRLVLVTHGKPRQVRAALVPSNFFSMLGIRPRLGRTFPAQADEAGHNHEIVITDRLWRSQFDANPAIIGEAVDLSGAPSTVVGVLAPDFRFPAVWGDRTPELFEPVVLRGADLHAGFGNFRFTAIARLNPGATPQQALAELDAVESQIAAQGDPFRQVAPGQLGLYATLTPLKTAIVGPAARALWMLTAAAALILLIICANLANLLLAKNTDRAHEVSLRAALGATAGRLRRQFLTEGLLLAAAGGALGLLLACGALQYLVRSAPVGIPRIGAVHLNATALWFTLGLSVAAALLFSVLPVLLLTRVPPAEALKAAGARIAGPQRQWLRRSLAIAEIALCAVLLSGALLLIQSLNRVARGSQWMQQQRVLTAKLVLPQMHFSSDAAYAAAMDSFYQRTLRAVNALPGVVSASVTPVLPLHGFSWGDPLTFQELPRPAAQVPSGSFYFIAPGFARTIGLPLLAGRALSPDDRGKNVVVISESVARELLPGRDPIGAHFMWSPNQVPVARTVIGVVGNIRTAPDAPPALAVYVPTWIFAEADETLVVRTRTPPAAAAAAIRRAVWSVNPQVAIPQVETLDSVLATSVAPRRYETLLGSLFALCAVILAALGLYGVMSYAVSQRRQEFGVRLALGAQRGDVLRSVVLQGMATALIGIALGLAAALASMRLLTSQLYQIRPDDPLTFFAVALFLGLVALLACYLPARRATRVNPVTALRCA